MTKRQQVKYDKYMEEYKNYNDVTLENMLITNMAIYYIFGLLHHSISELNKDEQISNIVSHIVKVIQLLEFFIARIVCFADDLTNFLKKIFI